MAATRPEEMPQAFSDAFNSGDVDAVMALYEPDAVLVPEPGRTVAGSAAIREALQGFLALKGRIELRLKRAISAGDTALVSSSWSLAGTGPDGSPVALSGDTTEVVRRQADGTWRYVIDDPFSLP
jgi:uncharacterized protein (TIGR02246 family)